ncbi:MAG TPA: sulfite exporter TauE/SafE family protein [Ktedonobacterales bacterium]|nr:sulfite exporter TauE/SafE family protein [Ktedonobacterales bacterium]
MDARLTLIGLLVGILVGFSGIGGSSFTTPLLILFLGVKPLVAVGTDLLYSAPTKLFGAIIHGRQGTVSKHTVLYLSVGGIPGALAGIAALIYLQSRIRLSTLNAFIQHGVGLVLLVAAAMLLLTPLYARWRARSAAAAKLPEGELTASRPPSLPKGRLIVLGALVGVVVSLSSIGSGSLTLPMLGLLVPQLGLRLRVGSDIAFAALLVPVAALGHLALGDVNVLMSANLLIGSIPGVFVGSKLCKYLPDVWMRPTMGGVLLLAASRLL